MIPAKLMVKDTANAPIPIQTDKTPTMVSLLDIILDEIVRVHCNTLLLINMSTGWSILLLWQHCYWKVIRECC